jgi:hypothetical protein
VDWLQVALAISGRLRQLAQQEILISDQIFLEGAEILQTVQISANQQ